MHAFMHARMHVCMCDVFLSLHTDFSNGVCDIMKITMAESDPDMQLLTQPFCSSPDVAAEDIRCQQLTAEPGQGHT